MTTITRGQLDALALTVRRRAAKYLNAIGLVKELVEGGEGENMDAQINGNGMEMNASGPAALSIHGPTSPRPSPPAEREQDAGAGGVAAHRPKPQHR